MDPDAGGGLRYPSTDAITANYEEILPPLLAGLKQAGLEGRDAVLVRYGRVKIEDQIGEILGAKVVILLVGERVGPRPVGEPSLLRGTPCGWRPLSRPIRPVAPAITGGTLPVEAAAVIGI